MATPNQLPFHGNETTMNLNQLVHSNIMSSPYFRSLYDKKTYHEVLQEIYDKVDSLEPFMKSTIASTAFCLLFKLWTLRLTVKQVDGMLKKDDNGQIRALALLYLRYTLPPAQLMEWFEPYLEDEEEVKVERGPPERYMTLGQIAYTLLTSPKWLGTMLPRIPVPVAKSFDAKIAPLRKKYGSTGGMDVGGGRVDTRFPPPTKAAGSGVGENRGEGMRRESERSRDRGGDRDRDRGRSRDRAPGSGYGYGGGYGGYGYGGPPRGRSRDRSRDRYDGGRDRGYDSRDRDRDRSDRDRSDKDRKSDDRKDGSYKSRDRSRSPRRTRSRSR